MARTIDVGVDEARAVFDELAPSRRRLRGCHARARRRRRGGVRQVVRRAPRHARRQGGHRCDRRVSGATRTTGAEVVSDLHAGWTDEPPLDAWLDLASLATRVGSAPRVALLAHNPLNAVTGGIWRVAGSDGSVVVKVVTDGRRHEGPDWWAASAVDHHWNSWRREVLVYRDRLSTPARARRAGGTGAARRASSSTTERWCWCSRMSPGAAAVELTVDDLVELRGSAGPRPGPAGRRWRTGTDPGSRVGSSASTPSPSPWTMRCCVDPAAWRQPMVAAHLEPLRGWRRVAASSSTRVDGVRGAVSADVLPSRRLAGQHRPPRRMVASRSSIGRSAVTVRSGRTCRTSCPTRSSTCSCRTPASTSSRRGSRTRTSRASRTGGWRGDERWLRLGIRSPAAKYHWLGARLLVDAGRPRRIVYGGREVDADEFYAARAAGVALLCRWADEALALAGELGLRP